VLLAQLLTTVARILGPGGTKAVVAENLLLKQQLPVLTRSRRRAPNLSATDRLLSVPTRIIGGIYGGISALFYRNQLFLLTMKKTPPPPTISLFISHLQSYPSSGVA